MADSHPGTGKRLRKVLIANRGEIAVRIIRALPRDGDPRRSASTRDADRAALHVRWPTRPTRIGPAPSRESYLRAEAIVDAGDARSARMRSIPGYGFLAENADFARPAREAGITFIGPPPEAIDAMGAKIESRARPMMEAGVPVVPGGRDRGPTEAARGGGASRSATPC